MKLARLVDERLHQALGKLSKEALPLKIAFRLKGITKIVDTEYAKYEEVRKEALGKYGDKGDDGEILTDGNGNVKLSKDGMQNFMKELAELANMDIDVPTIKLSELNDSIQLTLQDVEMLDGILIDE